MPGLLFLLLMPGCAQVGGTPSPAAPVQVEPAPGRFVDVAAAAGLDYAWKVPGKRPLNILQTIGNGCAFLDFNNDGNLDILLVGSPPALYRGDGAGKFANVSREAGLDRLEGHFLGCAVGDVDSDGFDDIYLSGYRAGTLLKNAGGKTFRDITARSGLKPQPWGTSAAFAETIPGSGRLDLYVANYAVFGPEVEPQLCNEQGKLTSCGPRYYQPLKGVLYRNDGKSRFTDITRESGAQSVTGKGLGVAVADYDGSGRPAFAIANDEMPGDLLRPVGSSSQPRYANAGEASNTAYDRDGNVHGGMGIDWGDADNDGKLDLFVATFQNETKSLYRNDGGGLFSDVGMAAGVGAAATPHVAFGAKFLDFDNDGWLDLVIANGHVQDNIQEINPAATYQQPSQLFRNSGKLPLFLEDVSASAPDLQRPIVGRGLAVGDYDNDGRQDILIVDSEGKPLLLHNESREVGHWLGARLIGSKSNHNGYGATLTAKIGERALLRQCQSAGSYLSASDTRAHFGLGAATSVDSLTVRWPGGRTDTYRNLPADRYITIREGEKTAR